MKQSSIHTAIIMDGNGRWANHRGLPRIAGHSAGAETLRRIVEAAPGMGIGTLTVYAFSSDNWKRAPAEVEALMFLLGHYFANEAPRLAAAGVRTSVIGRRDRLPETLLTAIQAMEDTTREGTRLHLRLAIDYSAREAIVRAAGTGHFEEMLNESPEVDLLIRTGGEQRLSDFLLWESAYAELVFSRRMWPEFTAADLHSAIRDFHGRDRRYGGMPGLPQSQPAPADRWLH